MVRRLALLALAVLLVLLVASQLALPRLAERDLRAELAPTGDVRDVEVDAFPAVTLLAERADAVRVRIGAAEAGTGRLGDLLASTKRTDSLDARAATLRLGPLDLSDLQLTKRGGRLDGRATLTRAALVAALPPQVGFRPVASGDGQLVLEATAGLFGTQATVRARLLARDGALVVAPDGLLGGLASFTVFADPRIEMTGVGARESAGGYALTATGRLRP